MPVLAVNSGHGSWWIGLPIGAVVLVARVALWRGRGRFGRWGNRGGGDDRPR